MQQGDAPWGRPGWQSQAVACRPRRLGQSCIRWSCAPACRRPAPPAATPCVHFCSLSQWPGVPALPEDHTSVRSSWDTSVRMRWTSLALLACSWESCSWTSDTSSCRPRIARWASSRLKRLYLSPLHKYRSATWACRPQIWLAARVAYCEDTPSHPRRGCGHKGNATRLAPTQDSCGLFVALRQCTFGFGATQAHCTSTRHTQASRLSRGEP